jgi:acyl-CoA thioester hydrolase
MSRDSVTYTPDALRPSETFRFSHPLRVRWAEVDPQGIVFNPNYLMYFDVGITEYWRAIGCPYPGAFLAQGADTFLVKATVEYKAPARFDDAIDVLVRVRRVGRSSMTVLAGVRRGVEQLVSGELVYVFAGTTDRKSMPVPESIRRAVILYEPSAVEIAS